MDSRPPARPGPIVMELKGDRTYLVVREERRLGAI
jgi:hypothetical protein